MSSLPVVAWANATNPLLLGEWIHNRLHGQDFQWPRSDDGFDSPHCLISAITRHPEASLETCLAITRATCQFLREQLPAWASQPDKVPEDHLVAGWCAPAFEGLLRLGSDLLAAASPSRTEVHALLNRFVPDLPHFAGPLPLRARGLRALLDFGGNSSIEFWKSQAGPDYPQATTTIFAGIARQDVEAAMRWLGETQSIKEQAQVLRKFRPTLLRRTGSQEALGQLISRHLFKANSAEARELRDEFVPDFRLWVRRSEITLLKGCTLVFPEPQTLTDKSEDDIVTFEIPGTEEHIRAVGAICQSRYETAFNGHEFSEARFHAHMRASRREISRFRFPNQWPSACPQTQ